MPTHPDRAALTEDVHPETAQSTQGVREVHFEVGRELCPLLGGAQLGDELLEGLRLEARPVAEWDQAAIDTEQWRQAALQVDVGRASLNGHLEDGREVDHAPKVSKAIPRWSRNLLRRG